MRLRAVIILNSVLALALTGCAAPGASDLSAGPTDTSSADHPSEPSESSALDSAGSANSEAQDQARAWLDAAVLPPGAVPADASVATFSSRTGWPCGPVARLEAFWSIPGVTVSDTANWLRENPTGNLRSTSVGPVPDDPGIQSAVVGYIPVEGAQEGVVYTVEQTESGVAVRAEVAAQTEDASCPVLPEGEQFGAPGQG